MADDLEEIKNRLSVEDVLEMLDLPGPDRTGKIPCFGHEEGTPSLHVYADHWRAYCCGQGGDIFDLVKFATGCSTGKAIAFLEGVADGFEAVVQRSTTEAQELREFTDRYETERDMVATHPTAWNEAVAFLEERWPHLTMSFLAEAGVVPGPYHLLIPHRDDEGVIRGVKTRATIGGTKGAKSAWTGSCFTTQLYRHTDLWHARGVTVGTVVLVEGESDCWTATKALGSLAQVLALPSGSSCIKPAFVEELARYERIILALDSDEAGTRAATTLIGALNAKGQSMLERFNPDPYKDLTEWYLAQRDDPGVDADGSLRYFLGLGA